VLQKLSATSYDTGWLTLPADYITSVSSPLSVTTGNLTVDLSAYLTSATAASTYQTLAGMSSYLTTATAASTYYLQTNPSGFQTAADVTTALSPYLLSATAASTYAVIAAGQPVAGTTGQVLTKQSGSNWDSIWTTIIPGDRYLTSSTTSNTVSTGNKTFTIGTGLSYTPTQNITISYDASNHMHGEVLTYNSGTGVLTVDIKNHTGSGTYTAWVVNVGGVTPATSVAWGAITGTLSSQTDLQSALDLKLAATTAAATYQTLAGMSSYLTTSTAASTYQPLAGMSSYLTTANAATTYATILEPSVDGVLTVEPSGVNSAELKLNQDANNYIHLRPYASQIAIVYGGVTKWFFNDTYLQFPGGTQQTVAYPGSSTFLLKADNLSGLADTAVSRTNLGLGTMAVETASNYLTTATASATYFTIASAANKADLASPTFTGTPLSTTAAADTNTTQIATTAYVVGQASSTTPANNGTAAVGTSLKYARADHVHGTDTTRAPLASPTFTGTPTAPTATAGTNTTQLATTAFVLANAGSTSFATTAQVVAATSTSTALAPSNQGFVATNPRLQSLAFINSASASGSGASTTSTPQTFSRQVYLSTLAVGRSAFLFGVFGSANAGFGTSTAKADQVDFSKKVWIAGYAMMGYSGSPNYLGDANTMCRITLGGYSTNTTGDMTLKGIGLKKVGGVASTVSLTVHDGTTRTDVASSVTVPDGGGIQWQIYSDGTGNVTLYINGTQAATTTAGPTTATASGSACYREQVEAVAIPGVRQVMNCNGGWFYTE
jgi:hypothetical protein